MEITAWFQRSRALWIATGMLASVVFLWSTLAWSQGNGAERDGEDTAEAAVEMAEAAKVTIQEAIQAASAKVPGKVVEAELDEKPVVVWEVEIVTDEGKVMQLYVDIRTGAVIETMEKKSETEQGIEAMPAQ
ncbi:MAG: PepSY domain-containing protein [Nitrospiraceae bacterium]